MNQDFLEFNISPDTIRVSSSDTTSFKIRAQLTNTSSNELIIYCNYLRGLVYSKDQLKDCAELPYGFNTLITNSETSQVYTSQLVTTGSEHPDLDITLDLDSVNNNVISTFPNDSIFNYYMDIHKNKITNSRTVIFPGEILVTELSYSVYHYFLDDGTYTLKIYYLINDRIFNIINEANRENLFTGCIGSNEIKIIVETK